MRCHPAIVGFLVSTIVASSGAQNVPIDGNWWLQLPVLVKEGYVLGLWDGTMIGGQLATMGLSDEAARKDAAQSFTTDFNKYVAGITVDQMVDGLNVFYEDYRNRNILVRYAVWPIVYGISGMPQPKIDSLIAGYRRDARKPDSP
jgi:hypothetical protein